MQHAVAVFHGFDSWAELIQADLTALNLHPKTKMPTYQDHTKQENRQGIQEVSNLPLPSAYNFNDPVSSKMTTFGQVGTGDHSINVRTIRDILKTGRKVITNHPHIDSIIECLTPDIDTTNIIKVAGYEELDRAFRLHPNAVR